MADTSLECNFQQHGTCNINNLNEEAYFATTLDLNEKYPIEVRAPSQSDEHALYERLKQDLLPLLALSTCRDVRICVGCGTACCA
jgi:ribonuclease I